MTSHAPAPSHNPQRLVLLGSTGSIGTQTLEVLSRLGEHAPRVAALAAGGSRLELLARQAITWEVPVLAVTGRGEDGDLSDRLRQALRAAAAQAGRPDPVTTILTGPDAATTAVQAAELGAGDTVVNGITGSVGLLPTLAALASGARLALANKESLVVGGALVRQALTRPGQIVPVDSEHSAIAQASPPDMRLPIALGLTWPERPDLSGLVTPNDWREPVSWTFEPLDGAAFPAVDLARSAVAASDTHPTVLNAANEQAVAAFLAGGLEWLDIVEIDAAVVGEHEGLTGPGLDDVLAVETWARARADELIAARNGGTHS